MVHIAADVALGEDSLTYLPRKSVQEFTRGRIIYSILQPADKLYLVVLGRVKVSTRAEDAYRPRHALFAQRDSSAKPCWLPGIRENRPSPSTPPL